MSKDPMEPFESAENFNEDIGMFQAAAHAPPLELPSPKIGTIVLALDGSPRDATVRGYGDVLAARTGAKLEPLSGIARAADIIAASGNHCPDLLILPVPFGQDYDELGSDSLGSVADQMLLKSSCPMLCVREVQDPSAIEESLDSVFIPIAVADDLVPRALGWAFRVTPLGGRIDLVAVADRDVLEEARHLAEEQPQSSATESELLMRAVLRDIAPLVAAAQKRGATENRIVHVETRTGEFVPTVLAEMHERPHALIWSNSQNRSSPAFHRAVDLLLSSKGAILLT